MNNTFRLRQPWNYLCNKWTHSWWFLSHDLTSWLRIFSEIRSAIVKLSKRNGSNWFESLFCFSTFRTIQSRWSTRRPDHQRTLSFSVGFWLRTQSSFDERHLQRQSDARLELAARLVPPQLGLEIVQRLIETRAREERSLPSESDPDGMERRTGEQLAVHQLRPVVEPPSTVVAVQVSQRSVSNLFRSSLQRRRLFQYSRRQWNIILVESEESLWWAIEPFI